MKLRRLSLRKCVVLCVIAVPAFVAVAWWMCSNKVEECPASQVFVFPDSPIIAQAMAFSPDKRLLAVGLAGPSKCGTPIKIDRIVDPLSERYEIELAPLDPGAKGVMFILDLVSDKKIVASMELPEWCNTLTFTPDGATLVAGIGCLGVDPEFSRGGCPTVTPSTGKLMFWDTKSWKKTGELNLPGAVLSIIISPNGKLLATMSSKSSSPMGTEVTIWDLETHTRTAGFQLEGYSMTPAAAGPVQPLAFSPDSRFLAASETMYKPNPKYLTLEERDDPARVVVWNIATKTKVKSLVAGWSPGTSVAFSEDGRHLIAAAIEGIAVWDTKTWQQERRDVCPGVLSSLYDDRPIYFQATWPWCNGVRCAIIHCQGNKVKSLAHFVSPASRNERYAAGDTRVIALSSDRKSVAIAGRGREIGVWNMPDLSKNGR